MNMVFSFDWIHGKIMRNSDDLPAIPRDLQNGMSTARRNPRTHFVSSFEVAPEEIFLMRADPMMMPSADFEIEAASCVVEMPNPTSSGFFVALLRTASRY
jgi:hypothetical protein